MERIQGKKWEEFIGLVWFFCFVLFSGEPHIGNKDLHELQKELSPGSYCIPAVTISIYVNPE